MVHITFRVCVQHAKLQLLFRKPTRVSSQSATMLGQIWYIAISKILRSGINLNGITDHFPVFIDLNIRLKNNNQADYSGERAL